jgi:hypothetical protein
MLFQARERINNRLISHMTPSPGIEPEITVVRGERLAATPPCNMCASHYLLYNSLTRLSFPECNLQRMYMHYISVKYKFLELIRNKRYKYVCYRAFSRDVVAAMLVSHEQHIFH